MKLNSLLGWGLAVGGGYLLLRYLGYDPLSYFTGSTTAAVTTVGSGTPVNVSGASSSSPQAQTQQATISQSNTKSQVLAALAADKVNVNNYQSSDLFNYYYQKVRGIPAPSPETLFPGVDRNMLHSFDEWWNAMTAQGMSGIGAIANYVNPYEMSYRVRGASIGPTGWEKMDVRFIN